MRRHWDLYAKTDASIGLTKKPQNIVFSFATLGSLYSETGLPTGAYTWRGRVL